MFFAYPMLPAATQSIPPHDMLIVLGDFNSSSSTCDNGCGVLGPFGSGSPNDNTGHMIMYSRMHDLSGGRILSVTLRSLHTGLTPVSDQITRGRNAIFGHVARLPDNIPAHQAMLHQVELSVGRPRRPYMETSTRSTTCQMDRATPPR